MSSSHASRVVSSTRYAASTGSSTISAASRRARSNGNETSMTPKQFVHLHNHSQYSLLDGASKLDDLLGKAAEFGMTSMAVTDHGKLFGAVKFFDMAISKGIKPILGMEAYVAPGDRRDRAIQAEGTQGSQKKPYY